MMGPPMMVISPDIQPPIMTPQQAQATQHPVPKQQHQAQAPTDWLGQAPPQQAPQDKPKVQQQAANQQATKAPTAPDSSEAEAPPDDPLPSHREKEKEGRKKKTSKPEKSSGDEARPKSAGGWRRWEGKERWR